MEIDFFKEDEIQEGYTLIQKIVYSSAAIASFIIVIALFLYIIGAQENAIIMMLLGIMIGVMPYGLISFFKNRAVREIENQFPSFLKDLAESKRGGMTILKSFESARDTDYGRLNNEITKIHDQLTWGIPFPRVMGRFSKRMDESAVIQESISIIIQSFKSGGHITETIQSVADDASMLREVLQDKDSKLKQQLFIIYIIYFLFIGIISGTYFMMGELLGLGTDEQGAMSGMAEIMGEGGESGEGGQGIPKFCGDGIAPAEPFCSLALVFNFVPENISQLGYSDPWVNEYGYAQMGYYKSLLFTILMIQGIAIAALAGQVSQGTPAGGVKHGMILLPVAFVAFIYVVGSAGV